jgi:hypothetical protein
MDDDGHIKFEVNSTKNVLHTINSYPHRLSQHLGTFFNYLEFQLFMNTISNLPTTLKSTAQSIVASMTSLPKTYKAAVFEKADAPFTIKDLDTPKPKQGEILVKVIACGVVCLVFLIINIQLY